MLPAIGRRRAGLDWRLRNTLDELARSITFLRIGAALVEENGRRMWWGECEKCGRTRWLSWCHVFTRGSYSVRWDPDNAFAWCSGCHRMMDQHWEIKHDWVVNHIGAVRYAALRHRKDSGHRVDYAAVKVALELEKRRLEA